MWCETNFELNSYHWLWVVREQLIDKRRIILLIIPAHLEEEIKNNTKMKDT